MQGLIPSDVAILDLLRKRDGMSVAEFESSLGVTATAVRQRLTRLLAQGLIRREPVGAAGRGRPSHRYRLTRAGRRKTGANFADLAVALWQEIRAIRDPEVRRGLLKRIALRMADLYRGQVEGRTVEERMESVAELFAARQIPIEVRTVDGELPVLAALACPYPDLADEDRTVCAMERMLFAELLGEPVSLDACRLDGEDCCTFRVQRAARGEGVEAPGSQSGSKLRR